MFGNLLRWLGGLGLLFVSFKLFRSKLCRLLGCNEELLRISSPAAGGTITSPLAVSGWGQAAQHNQLAIEVRDASNTVLGSGTATITGMLGQPGSFSGSVTFAPATPGSPGHVQVFDTSPATGAVTHLASVQVTFG